MDDLERALRAAADATRADAERGLDVDRQLATTIDRAARLDGSTPASVASSGGRVRVWLAAAAVVSAIGGGIVLVGQTGDDRLATTAVTDGTHLTEPARPTTTVGAPSPTTVATGAATTTPATTNAPASTVSAAATTVPTPVPTVTGPGAVSYLDPPPELTLQPLGEVDIPAPGEGAWSVAMGDTGVLVGSVIAEHQPDVELTVIGFDGRRRTLTVPGTSNVGLPAVYGPGDVGYFTQLITDDPPDGAMVAIPLSGARAGQAVASAPFSWSQYTDLPRVAFGHGPDGVRDLARDIGATMIGYADTTGRSIGWDGPSVSLFTLDDELRRDALSGTVTSSSGVSWDLRVEASPERAVPFVEQSLAAPTSNGDGVYWTHVGPNLALEQNLDIESGWVIAHLAADGGVTWWSLPDGWIVADSGVWGTVLARHDGGVLELALADFGGGVTLPTPRCPALDTSLPDDAVALGTTDGSPLGLVELYGGFGDGVGWTLSAVVDGDVVATAEVGGIGAQRDLLAITDLDRNGAPEFFVSVGGNTARWASAVELVGCELLELAGDDGEPVLLLIGASGGTCGSTGCFVSNSCVRRGDETVLVGLEAFPDLSDTDADADPPYTVVSTEYGLRDGVVRQLDESTEAYPSLSAVPSDVPRVNDSDFIC